MKKKVLIFICATLSTVMLAACGNNGTDLTSTNTGDTNSAIQVDEGLFNVTITIDSSLMGEGVTQESLEEATKDMEGIKSVTLNADGSATYVMTKSGHEKWVKETAESMDESLDEMVGSESYPNITKIERNNDFTEFTVYTNNEEPDFAESFSVLMFYITGRYYNQIAGNNPDDIIVYFYSNAKGEIVKEAHYKDMNKESNDSETGSDSLEEENSVTLNDVYNWYVGDIWNNLVDFQWYISSGTSCTGGTLDADFAYAEYLKKYELKDEYTEYIHTDHPDIIYAWDKMMEQVEIINSNLADGYEVGSDNINLDLLGQYDDAFYDYCRENW